MVTNRIASWHLTVPLDCDYDCPAAETSGSNRQTTPHYGRCTVEWHRQPSRRAPSDAVYGALLLLADLAYDRPGRVASRSVAPAERYCCLAGPADARDAGVDGSLPPYARCTAQHH